MKILKTIKAGRTVPLILLALLALTPLAARSSYTLQIFITVFIAVYFSSCWNIIGGYAGQFALGNVLYVGVGAYTAGIFMQEGLSPWLALIVGGVIAVVIAIAVSILCFRLSGTYFALATVAFLYMARYLMLGTDKFLGFDTNGGLGITIHWIGGFKYMQFTEKRAYYYIFLVLVVIVLLVSDYIRKSRAGMYMSAIKTNQGAASTIGINVVRYKMYAQCACAFFMAVGGAAYVIYLMVVDPYKVLGYDMSLEIMMYAVIGGVGTLWGPVIGAASLTVLSEFLRIQFGDKIAPMSLVAYGLIMILIIMFAPDGMMGLVYRIGEKIKKRFSKPDEAKGAHAR